MVIFACLCAAISTWAYMPDSGSQRLLAKERFLWTENINRLESTQIYLAVLSAAICWMVIKNPFLSLMIASLILILPWAEKRRMRKIRHDCLIAQLPSTLLLLAVVMESGVAMRTAVEKIGQIVDHPTADILQKVSAHIQIGRTEIQAWQELGDDEVWGAIARDLSRSFSAGSAISEILYAHAQQAQQLSSAHIQTRARSVGVYSIFPLIICFLPAFILIGVVPIIAGTIQGFIEHA